MIFLFPNLDTLRIALTSGMVPPAAGMEPVEASFDAEGLPLRVLLYNSDYYAGTGTRPSQSFELGGLKATSVRAKRLTAASAMTRQDQGGTISFGGQSFDDGTCIAGGAETFETVGVSNGSAAFNLMATEALLVYLQ